MEFCGQSGTTLNPTDWARSSNAYIICESKDLRTSNHDDLEILDEICCSFIIKDKDSKLLINLKLKTVEL